MPSHLIVEDFAAGNVFTPRLLEIHCDCSHQPKNRNSGHRSNSRRTRLHM